MKIELRAFCLILAVLMLAAAFTACSDTPADTGASNADGAGGQTDTDAATEDPVAALYAALPTGKYSGREFNILVPTHLETEYRGEQSPDIVNDAIYNRNLAVEEKLGVTLNICAVAGLWDDQSIFLNTVKSSVMAKDDAYQLVSGYGAYITSLSSSGLLANWNDVPKIDFTKTWWNSDVVSEMDVGGRLYFVTGDMSLTSLEYLFCLFFNKSLVDKFSLEDPYVLVRSGKWTLDTVAKYTAEVSGDADGDGAMTENDLYGYVSDDSNYISAFQAAFDANVTEKDADGIPRLVVDSESFFDKFSALYAFLRESPGSYLNNMTTSFSGMNEVTTSMFKSNRALIMADMLGNAAALRDLDTDFGILPYPKFDESQKEYHTTAWDAYTLFCVPITSDLEFLGPVVENLAAYSYTTVTPAFYEKALKSKYARDAESSEMIDIIRAGATYNFGTVNSIQCGSCGHIFRSLVQNSDPNIASFIASRFKGMSKSLDAFVEKSYMN